MCYSVAGTVHSLGGECQYAMFLCLLSPCSHGGNVIHDAHNGCDWFIVHYMYATAESLERHTEIIIL